MSGSETALVSLEIRLGCIPVFFCIFFHIEKLKYHMTILRYYSRWVSANYESIKGAGHLFMNINEFITNNY